MAKRTAKRPAEATRTVCRGIQHVVHVSTGVGTYCEHCGEPVGFLDAAGLARISHESSPTHRSTTREVNFVRFGCSGGIGKGEIARAIVLLAQKGCVAACPAGRSGWILLG